MFNAETATQRIKKNEETVKYVPKESVRQISRNQPQWNENTDIPCFQQFSLCHFAFMQDLPVVPVLTN